MTRLTGVFVCLLMLDATAEDDGKRRFMSPAELQKSVLAKLEYDTDYFKGILQLKKEGRTSSRLSATEFTAEVRRGETYLPYLQKQASEVASYGAGQAFTLPENDERFRVYINLVAMLNMLQAFERGDYLTADQFGSKVVVQGTDKFGVVRAGGSEYYVNLYREFFYAMAVTYYRLGRDADAVRWFERIEADQYLAKMKAKVQSAKESEEERRAARLEQIRVKPLAILPFDVPAELGEIAWMKTGLPEVLTADLARNTDLRFIERQQLESVMTEAKLAEMGLTTPKGLARFGQISQAGSVLLGSAAGSKEAVVYSVKLVDPETGEVLAGATRKGMATEPFGPVRDAAIEVLERVGFVDGGVAETVRADRLPSLSVVKDLATARLMLATKGNTAEAKALFEKAMKEDPAYASLYADLRASYADVNATLAVLPFLNVTGDPSQAWIVTGVNEALTTDLPKLSFNVVERAQMQAMLEQIAVGEMIAPDTAKELGRKANADFMMLGAILQQPSVLRIDARFVDVKTGTVLFSASAMDRKGDLPKVVSQLVIEIARQCNRPLDEKARETMGTARMTKEDFEQAARRRVAQDAASKGAAPVMGATFGSTAPVEPTRWSRWAFASGAVAAGTGGWFAWRTYSDTVLSASATTLQSRTETAASARDSATLANVSFGIAGVAATLAATLWLNEP